MSIRAKSVSNPGATTYKLVYTTEPSASIAAGNTLPVGGVIEIEDNNGNLITSGPLSTATISLSDSTGNGNISGVISVTASGGVATIPNNMLMFEKTGTTSLTASTTVSGIGTLSSNSSSITIAAPSYATMSAFSGPNDPNGSVDGDGTTSARLWQPMGVVSDGTYIYIEENYPNCLIRRYQIASPYAVSTWAGQLYNCGYTDGAYGTNTIGGDWANGPPIQMATDGTYIYFVDNHAIRRAAISNGSITTIAGSPTSSGYLDNTTGTSAKFGNIGGIYASGTTLYVADNGSSGSNCFIRAVDISTSPYAVTTVAGTGTCAVLDNSSPLSAEVASINYFAADATNLYFSDNGDIRQMNLSTGAVTTDATNVGNSACGGTNPNSIAVVSTSMYMSCQSIITAATIGTWTWSTVAGKSWASGDVDGALSTSQIGGGFGGGSLNYNLLYASGTNVYWGDSFNGALRVLDTTTNNVTTLAGTPNSGSGWAQNATSANTRFEDLQDLVSDGTNLYGFDFGTNLFPVISTSTGSSGTALGSGWGLQSPATQVLAYMAGKIYYVDPCKLWVVDPVADTIAALVGNNSNCVENEGNFLTATFTGLGAIATDQQNLYVADNHAIKKIDLSTQTVSVLSGQAGTSGCVTGTASASRYGSVSFMSYMNGNLYFTEYCKGQSIVQVNTQTGASTIVAGNGSLGYADGALANAQFGGAGYDYQSLPITSDGQNLYVYDAPNGAVRAISISGNSVTTLFGSTTQRWDVDGLLTNARESGGYQTGYNAIYYGYGKLYIDNGRGIRVVK